MAGKGGGSAGGMFIPAQVSHEELVDQVVKMGDELQQIRVDNATLKAQIEMLQGQGDKGK